MAREITLEVQKIGACVQPDQKRERKNKSRKTSMIIDPLYMRTSITYRSIMLSSLSAQKWAAAHSLSGYPVPVEDSWVD